MAIGNSKLLNQEIENWIARVQNSVKDFNKKDRKKILVRAARPVVLSARKKVAKSKRPHYRNDGQTRIKYNPGNLRKSVKRLILKKSQDAFVGPEFAKRKVAEYGGTGQPTDGYYVAMLFGSAAAFNYRVLAPAISESEAKVRVEVSKAALVSIKKHAASRGIKTK